MSSVVPEAPNPEVFQRLVEGIRDYAIYMLDPAGRISSWNPGAERFKGYRREEVLGQHFGMFYTPEDRKAGRPERALATALNIGRFEDYAWRVRKSGERFWAHVVIDLIRSADGEPIGFAKITRDITERREAEARMLTLNKLNEELQQFVHVASHDLREPLRKVLAFSDLLFEETADQLNADQQMYLERIRSSTMRMQALLENLLNLTKVSSHGGLFEPCDLNQIVDDVLADLEVVVQERAADVSCGGLPTIQADGVQMRQLFQNLISNALKYCPTDRPPKVVIESCASQSEAEVAVAVSDNGIGFEAHQAEQIFGIFQRLHGRGEYDGSGVGLAICRKICERHGGSIRAEARPNQGARFVFSLKIRPDDRSS